MTLVIGQREDWRGKGRANANVGRGRAKGGGPPHLRQQAGSSKCYECCGDHRQAWSS